MNILVSSDEAYFIHAATAMHSAWFNNTDARFYLADCGIDPAALDTFSRFAEEIGLRLTVLPVGPDLLAGTPAAMTERLTTYARLLVARLLPDTADRVIYLDADVIVIDDLSDLWGLDLSGRTLAGVQDDRGLRAEREHGLPGHGSGAYINAGVLLIDLRRWREKACERRLIDFVESQDSIFQHDQTALNTVLGDEIRIVSNRWNFMPAVVWDDDAIAERPAVIHYAGASKPWVHTDALFFDIYNRHRAALPFGHARPTERYRSQARYLLNLLFLRNKYLRRWRWQRRFGRALQAAYPTRPIRQGENRPR